MVSVLLGGCACSYKTLRSGRRQIVGFYFPGEFCDLAGLFLPEIGYGVAALGPCLVARARVDGLCALLEENAAIGSALWRLSLLDAAILREWMVGMGRRPAQAQVAHLLCEVLMRWRAAGQAPGETCPLPMTQADMADALGLSVVQVNKELQRLRAEGLIVLSRGTLRIENPARLARLGDFSPSYLQMPDLDSRAASTAA
jgi:CRP-like cAMP-binding protein